MTKRLHFLVEGRTEFNFVNQILKGYLERLNRVQSTVSMLTTKRERAAGRKYSGGSPSYSQLSKEIRIFLKDKSSDFRLTTMIDLYGFPTGFLNLSTIGHSPHERVKEMEQGFFADFNDIRFIPYIQLHEYEALLFADPQKFAEIYENFKEGIKKLVNLSKTTQPEEINDGERTAPSKRIISQIPRYEFEKSSVGANVANHIGLETIRRKCPHFNSWVEKLENL
jgi:hypothetical protein